MHKPKNTVQTSNLSSNLIIPEPATSILSKCKINIMMITHDNLMLDLIFLKHNDQSLEWDIIKITSNIDI